MGVPSRLRARVLGRVIRDGGVIAYPTEAVYGLGCDPANQQAVHRLLTLKRRSAAKGLILIADTVERLRGWASDSALDDDHVRRTWPGPVTWVLPAGPLAPPWIRGRHSGVAVRVTAHPVAAALSAAAGRPLVSTSANRHGRPPARRAVQVRRTLGSDVDAVVAGGVAERRLPSEIRLYPDGRVLRSG